MVTDSSKRYKKDGYKFIMMTNQAYVDLFNAGDVTMFVALHYLILSKCRTVAEVEEMMRSLDFVSVMDIPDDFSSWPSEAGDEPQTFNTNSSNWNGKEYSVEQFTALQNNGCVFLPAAGFRNGNDGNAGVSTVGIVGYYWSASPSDVSNAFCLSFFSSYVGVGPSSYGARYGALSVRVVTECE